MAAPDRQSGQYQYDSTAPRLTRSTPNIPTHNRATSQMRLKQAGAVIARGPTRVERQGSRPARKASRQAGSNAAEVREKVMARRLSTADSAKELPVADHKNHPKGSSPSTGLTESPRTRSSSVGCTARSIEKSPQTAAGAKMLMMMLTMMISDPRRSPMRTPASDAKKATSPPPKATRRMRLLRLSAAARCSRIRCRARSANTTDV
mmetsp:Transcript_41199/g.132963  ORF Transcript_41199/g.132963 Transcript_41199/m.132963 type:complete len:206 (+) Transcript_41199:126-743(+)